MAYSVKRVDGSGASMSDFKFRATVHFDIIHDETGNTAWSGTVRYTSDGARVIGGLRLAATKMMKRYEAYLARTGKRFEVEERERKAAERAEKKRLDRLAHLRKNVPLWTEELRLMELEEKSKGTP